MNGVQEKGNVEQEQSREQRMNEHEQWGVSNGSGQLINNGSFGFDATLGAFPTNMGFNGAGDFSQMMQFMPNSMPTNSMGAFPNMMGKRPLFSSSKLDGSLLIIHQQVCQEWGWIQRPCLRVCTVDTVGRGWG